MFNLEEFEQDQVVYPLVEKLSKLLEKNKIDKIEKVIKQLEELLREEEHATTVSYILSIIAEINPNLISESILTELESYITTGNPKLKINTFIIIGFAMLSDQKYLDRYLPEFILHLKDLNKDVRGNIYYFLQEVGNSKPERLCAYKIDIINALKTENVEENLISLMSFLEKCTQFDFENLYNVREVLKTLVKRYYSTDSSAIYNKILNLVKKLFPSINDLNVEDYGLDQILDAVQNCFLMKKHNFTEISESLNVDLKDYIKNLSEKDHNDRKISFYINQKEQKETYIYELEKEKLLDLFGKEEKLQKKNILRVFSPIIHTEPELRQFINMLIKLGHIKGFYSKLGFFYSYNYLKSEILNDFYNHGTIDLTKFDYFPPEFVNNIIRDISDLTKQVFLMGKNNTTYYSLKKIQQEINTEAAKNTIIDLKEYREHLLEKDFIRLIKNLPKGYLTFFRSGTQWLTNVGLLKVKKEIENSKLIGYYSIPMLSEKLHVKRELLVQVLETFIDIRSGIFDKNKEIFYYTKFLNQEIEKINTIIDQNEREKQINLMAKNLNIDRSHIITKLDENLKSIGEEIKEMDTIKINDYIEKTGMSYNLFIEFINDLGLNYFKKGGELIFKESKIEESKHNIKLMLINKSKSEDIIHLGDLDVTSSIVEELLKELQNDEKVNGVFHFHDGELIFYTEKGIENLMLENSFMFSFNDFFYDKILDDKEIETLLSIFNKLVSKKLLKGTFDNDSLTFASSDVIFAQDYNKILSQFEKIVTEYTTIFKTEFEKIKKILTKSKETIFPQEIKFIQERIDLINEKYIHWRNGIESFVRKANASLLKKQGFTIKKYKTMTISAEKKDEIKYFEEDPYILDLISEFNKWVKAFNELELKYGNVIFYQKRLINDADNKDSRKVLDDLLKKLNLI
ncbi:MAG: hypothetical protein EAX91_08040 [Candidatus Lokiarchaeota archaeon]|nr:hypothetical protein [Candidatus Lokiarchaeota archaeon]